MGDSHDVENADQTGQGEEPRVCLQQHSLNLVDLSSPSPLLGSLREPVRHGSQDLELHERHGLECESDLGAGRGAIQLDVVRAEMPKFVGEDNGIMLSLCASLIALIGNEVDICMPMVRQLGTEKAVDGTHAQESEAEC